MKRRKTDTQSAILDSLKKSKKALSHDMLQAELAEVDRATIYRALNRFSEDGILHKIIGDDGKLYFAVCTNCTENKHQHNHFHFRCRSCNKVECLANEIQVKVPEGYLAESFNAIVSGLCLNCR
ncbi:Fur family transcriptional regulator [Rubrolithibacter danxiaensis]|uniref:Fur family transcriptional regulator n=1 Tax=Rubrolithibacter danxiaensis TaxID=3390805 RepID=UPI003BF8F4B4